MGIQVVGVSQRTRFGARGLQGVTLQAERGLLALVGPAGAGKSTLLSLMGARRKPSAGTVRVDGLDARKAARQIRERVRYLSPDAGLPPELTLFEGLDYLALHRPECPADARRANIERVVEEFRLGSWQQARLGELSPGWRFRALVASTRLFPAPYLLLEEPSGGLSVQDRAGLASSLAGIARDTLVVVAANGIEGFEAAADRIAVLDRGILRYFGTPQRLLAALRDRAWSFDLPPDDVPPAISGFLRTRLLREPDRVSVRGIGETAPVLGAVRVVPTLQDAYVWMLAGGDLPSDPADLPPQAPVRH